MILVIILAKLLLFLSGWKQPSDKQFQRINKYSRSVVVFSHTSYADFFILILYLLAFPEQLKHIRILVKPGPFKYIGFILRRLGAIPCTKVTDKNGGSTQKIIDELNKQEQFICLISPKGTIDKSPWRNGYHAIASHFKIPLMTAGLDYEKKCVVVTKGTDFTEDKDKVENILKEQLGTIVPLFPEDEIVNIRQYDPNKVSIIKFNRLIMLLVVCYIGIAIRVTDKCEAFIALLFYIVAIAVCISFD